MAGGTQAAAMRLTCPECGAQAHVAAFFVEDDGKRLAGLFAEMEPVLP